MPFQIIRHDITKVAADAVVNSANPEPIYASGSDRAVYEAAGAEALLAERRRIGRIEPGEAAATGAGALPAKYIIHTVGPVWEGGRAGELSTLASCYRNSLKLAAQLGCVSIALPLISTGVYGFPKDRALSVALAEIRAFLETSGDDGTPEMTVTLVVYDRASFELSAGFAARVREYIREEEVRVASPRLQQYFGTFTEDRFSPGAMPNAARPEAPLPSGRSASPAGAGAPKREAKPGRRAQMPRFLRDLLSGKADEDAFTEKAEEEPPAYPDAADRAPAAPRASAPASAPVPAPPRQARSLDDLMSNIGETFQECLLRLIDERGMTDPEVYKRANIDRKLFSKIRSRADYQPSKRTVCAFAVALRLSLDETVDLLAKAGLALSPASRFDVLIKYCILNHVYDIFEVNALLFDYDQPLLG